MAKDTKKIVTWVIQDGCRNFRTEEISKEDFELAERCVSGFETKLQNGMTILLHDWVEYLQCKAIIFGEYCYEKEVEPHASNPMFPLIMANIQKKSPENN